MIIAILVVLCVIAVLLLKIYLKLNKIVLEDSKVSLIKMLLASISYYVPNRGFTLDSKVDPEELKIKVQQASKFANKIINLIKYGQVKQPRD